MKNPKKIFNLALIAAAACLLAINACKKHDDHDDDHDPNDKTIPVLTIQSPTNMQMYNNGDTVWIKGTLTDNSLHECYMVIKKNADSSILFEQSPTVHDLTSYDINAFWKSSVKDQTNATLTITAQDHNSNVVTKTVGIHIMP